MIVFACSFGNNLISGGLRTLYRHAEMLADLGHETLVVAPQGPPASFATRARIFRGGQLCLEPHDQIVFPEAVGADDGVALALLPHGGPKHVYVQNHFYMHMGIKLAPRWREHGLTRVYGSSVTIADYMRDYLGIPDPAVVPYCIDTALFRPTAKKLQIAVMPRKMPRVMEFIRETFALAHPDLAKVPWVIIDGRSEEEVAALLAESAVFLSLSHQEGFGLPPLEAMAAGCLVAGFHGAGGLEYATTANGFWYGADQLAEVTDGLAKAVRAAERGDRRYHDMRAAGHATVARYSIERTRQALRDYFGECA